MNDFSFNMQQIACFSSKTQHIARKSAPDRQKSVKTSKNHRNTCKDDRWEPPDSSIQTISWNLHDLT